MTKGDSKYTVDWRSDWVSTNDISDVKKKKCLQGYSFWINKQIEHDFNLGLFCLTVLDVPQCYLSNNASLEVVTNLTDLVVLKATQKQILFLFCSNSIFPAGLKSIDTYVTQRQLRWAGHVARMSYDRLPRKCYHRGCLTSQRCTGVHLWARTVQSIEEGGTDWKQLVWVGWKQGAMADNCEINELRTLCFYFLS